MKPTTVKELYKECKKQIDKGNGDKVIMISNDDEGNGYHYMWYLFTTIEEMEAPEEIAGQTITFEFDECDERIASKEDTIILG